MTRLYPQAVAAGLVAVGLTIGNAPVRTQQPRAATDGDLSRIFVVGGMLQDRNEDAVVDFIDARLVLGSSPSTGEIVAAAAVAARLGFETAALTLPLRREGRPIVIGASAVRGRGVSAAGPRVESLRPGEGLVSMGAIGGEQGVVIAGPDDAGTQAAAQVFSGRFPHLWDPSGPTLIDATAALRKVLTDRGVSVVNVSVPALVVSSDGIAKLVMTAGVASASDVTRSRQALNARRPPGVLAFGGVREVEVRVHAGDASVVVSLAGDSANPKPRPLGRRAGGTKDGLDLSNLYTIEGLLGDSDENLIPDRIETLLVPGAGMTGTADLAARLGLESAGISIPIATVAEAVTEPAEEPTLVLMGNGHSLIDRLSKERKLDPTGLQPGEGLISVVKKAFGEKPAVVITGGDRAGSSRALAQVAERFPHIWERGKDRTTIDDVEEDVRTLLGGRSPSGQAATALYKLDKIAAELAGKSLESASVLVSVEKPADGLADFIRREAAEKIKAGSLDVTIDDRDVQKAKNIFTQRIEIASEVDEFRELVRSKVLPAVRKKQAVRLEARLSEPPEIRAQLEAETRAALIRAGAPESSSVRVLSAYKQGYSWLYDEIRPALAGAVVESMTIRFAEIGPPAEWKQQAMFSPTRWLLELFPIDETLARDLKLDLKQIRFERMPIGSPTYEVIVRGSGGAEILRRTFEPKYVLRPFFDRFPDYEKVRVTTGWIRAEAAGTAIVDQRIITDPERFWDHFQSQTLAGLYDYLMRISKGKPRREDAPHFGELVVEVSLSEADYNLGIDKERISPLESIHEEVYFHTLHFVDVIGRNSRGEPLDYIGRVIPIVRPKQDGKPGFARITLSGFASNRPAVIVNYKERDGRQGEARLDIPKVDLQRPSATAALVKAGSDGLERLQLRVRVDTQRDERAALIKRARPEQVDAQMMSAEQVGAVVAHLGRLRAAGLYREALAYHQLRNISVTASWAHDPDPKTELNVSVPSNGSPATFPDIKKHLPAGYTAGGAPLVQWDTPIPPGESAEILAKMSTFPEATVYKVGESYLGKDVWAMDLLPRMEGTHVSHAKMTTLKPTIVYSGRQDANEVSSTSHILKLAELLLTDAEFKAKLKKVNVVIHPITNADGAQLAYDLYKITPDHMLHAGYLGPLGVSLVSRWDSDPIYPESRVRPKLWRTWLPDVFLNPHGYPSHEWVQLFSEYGGWVRNRVTEARDWQQMRGWFIPGFNYVDDPKYPRHKEAAMRIRQLITEHINEVPSIREFNQRAYARYRRYGHEHDPENFRMDFTNDVLIYTALKGNRGDTGTRNNVGDDYMVRRPNVTIFFGATEAPDETAYGDYMKFVATMGLQWDKANLEYLVQGKHLIERKVTPFFGGVSLSALRARPPKPEPPKPAPDAAPRR